MGGGNIPGGNFLGEGGFFGVSLPGESFIDGNFAVGSFPDTLFDMAY